jgi:hypothetical protein
MHWPQITMIVLFAINISVRLALHTLPHTDKKEVFATLLGTVINIVILYCGGFWG